MKVELPKTKPPGSLFMKKAPGGYEKKGDRTEELSLTALEEQPRDPTEELSLTALEEQPRDRTEELSLTALEEQPRDRTEELSLTALEEQPRDPTEELSLTALEEQPRDSTLELNLSALEVVSGGVALDVDDSGEDLKTAILKPERDEFLDGDGEDSLARELPSEEKLSLPGLQGVPSIEEVIKTNILSKEDGRKYGHILKEPIDDLSSGSFSDGRISDDQSALDEIKAPAVIIDDLGLVNDIKAVSSSEIEPSRGLFSKRDIQTQPVVDRDMSDPSGDVPVTSMVRHEPGLHRRVLGDDTIYFLEDKGVPDTLVGILGEMTRLHLLIGVSVVLALFAAILFSVSHSGDLGEAEAEVEEVIIGADEPNSVGGSEEDGKGEDVTSSPSTAAAKPSTEAKTKEPAESEDKTPEVHDSFMAENVPNVAPKALGIDLPAAVGKCRPLSMYGLFPWSDRLGPLVRATGNDGVCEMFNKTPDVVSTAVQDWPTYGPTGYDLLPGGVLFEIFPEGNTERNAPTMEFVFVENRLFEVRLKYGASVGTDFPDNFFDGLLGAPFEIGEDMQGRTYKSYYDGNMIVRFYMKKDNYQRVFREILFASKDILTAIRVKDVRRQKAQSAFVQGMESFAMGNISKSLAYFRKARKFVYDMGIAYVWGGIALLRNEKFKDASLLANRALKVSRDDRARAEAMGIKGVAALYEGKKEEAIALFRVAAKLDPTKSDFGISMNELETGKYRPERVAKTAARLSCKNSKNTPRSTTDGLLARGNFPDLKIYQNVLRQAKRKPLFKEEYNRWVSWECN